MSNCKIFLGAKIELAPDEWGALQSIKSTEFYKKLGYFFYKFCQSQECVYIYVNLRSAISSLLSVNIVTSHGCSPSLCSSFMFFKSENINTSGYLFPK